MKIAVIGTRWGRVHVDAFRRLGHEVAILIGSDLDNTRTVARAEGIPIASVDPDDALRADFVVIASPTSTHGALVRRLGARPLLCEKPLADPSLAHVPGLRLWVSYAFPFLDSASRFAAALAELGPVERFELATATRFDPPLSPERALAECGVHPATFLAACAGPFTPRERRRTSDALVLELAGAAPLTVRVTELPEPGIDHHLRAVGHRGVLELSASYRVRDDAWSFPPVLLNSAPISAGEGNVWIEAHHRLVAAVLRAHQHGVHDPRLFTPAQASAFEAPFLP